MDYNSIRPRAAPPLPLHHGYRHRRGVGDNYMDPFSLDHLSSVRRVNGVDITQTMHVNMNFRDYNNADAAFFNDRGSGPTMHREGYPPAPAYGYPHEYEIEYGYGPATMYRIPLPPPPPPPPRRPLQPGDDYEYGPRPPPYGYQAFDMYGHEDINPNQCSVM